MTDRAQNDAGGIPVMLGLVGLIIVGFSIYESAVSGFDPAVAVIGLGGTFLIAGAVKIHSRLDAGNTEESA